MALRQKENDDVEHAGLQGEDVDLTRGWLRHRRFEVHLLQHVAPPAALQAVHLAVAHVGRVDHIGAQSVRKGTVRAIANMVDNRTVAVDHHVRGAQNVVQQGAAAVVNVVDL
eukprot:4269584-Heterocapsa_arctica.AAC.1